MTAFGALSGEMVNVGKNLLYGVWNGIVAVADWFWQQIADFFNGIVGGIRNLLGINSPSTVFAEIGSNMGQGIGLGFENAMNKVARDMRNAVPVDFEMTGSFSGFGSSYGSRETAVVTQNIAITSPKALSEKEVAREFRNLSRKLAMGIV